MCSSDLGVTDLHREETDLVPLARRIAQRYDATNVPIVVADGCDGIGAVDKRRFERILANLLDNARIHGDGADRISIENHVDASGVHGVIVAVEDSGPGVAQSERSRIFERFARGSAGRSRAGGTGLGLALVAEHVRAHGGRTWVEDAPSGGARFVVFFPGEFT